MLEKIRYRLVWNKARRLNRRGEGLVEIECQQQGRRIYFSTHVYLRPGQWQRGSVVGCDQAEPLNYALWRMVQDVERVELEYIKRGTDVTLPMLREAIRAKISPAARLRDFGMEVVSQSDRKEQTKQNYQTLLNDLDRFRRNILITDVDYQFITRYDRYLREHVGQNTRISRLRLLRALINEARRRDLIALNPFDRFRIQQMVSRRGHLTAEQLRRMERMTLTGRDDRVRDLFLLGCYTGLRFSDLITLRTTDISPDGWISKRMQKTGQTVELPAATLFDGRALAILQKYGGDPRQLTSKTGGNAHVNKLLKPLLARAGCQEKITFHASRHTFATLLGQRGVSIETIQHLLGHQKVTTTEVYRESNRRSIEAGLSAGKPQRRKRR